MIEAAEIVLERAVREEWGRLTSLLLAQYRRLDLVKDAVTWTAAQLSDNGSRRMPWGWLRGIRLLWSGTARAPTSRTARHPPTGRRQYARPTRQGADMGQGETGGGPEGIGTAPTPEDAVQEPRTIRPLPWWAVLLLAALLVGSWSTWAVHAYRAEPRIVTMDELRSDLSAGTVRSYDVVTAMRSPRAWPPPDETSYDTAQTPDPGAPSTTGRGVMTVAYHVDSWVAPIRIVQVVPSEAGSDVVDVPEVIQELEAAGVRPGDRVPAEVAQADPRESAEVSGLVLGLLALTALLAIRPTRGTRWFWLWVFGAPLGLGVLAYVVAECLLPKRAAPPADGGRREGRHIGLVGFVIQVAAKFFIPY